MRLFLQLLLILILSTARGQPFLGARAYALGESVAALSGAGILLGNPASSRIQEYVSGYAHLPGVNGLNRMGFAMHGHRNFLSVEAGVQRLGDLTSSIDRLYTGFATKKGNTALGVRLNLHQFKTSQQQTDFTLRFSAGGITRLSPTLSFGAWIDHLSLNFKNLQEDFLPIRMEAGIAATLSNSLFTTASVLYQLNELPVLRLGLEYKILEKVDIRIGHSTYPAGVFAGAGFRYWKVTVDLASSWRKHEGAAFQATAGYRIISVK